MHALPFTLSVRQRSSLSSHPAHRLAILGTTTILLGSLAAACGSESNSTPEDASGFDAWQRVCWSGGGTPSAAVEIALGTGVETFQPIENEGTLVMHRGFQGGAHFELTSRMRGFIPGDIDDPAVPAPHTLFRAFNQSGTRLTPGECTFPKAYRDISADLGPGWYQLEYGTLVTLDDVYFPTLDGERIRIQMEVQDPAGTYAITERWVVVEDAGFPGVDAGVPDAGPDTMDASSP